MRARWIWVAAVLLYAGFSWWYVGVRGPLTPDEIESHFARLADSAEPRTAEQLQGLRRFLEEDDGREFFMVNLVRMHEGAVTAPGATSPAPAQEVLGNYTRHFMRALFWRAGHPAWFGRAVGRDLEQWEVPPNPGWSFAAAIRYRSRRDLIELVNDPRFAGAHAFKRAAIESTFAFPAAPGFAVLGPRVWVGLVLALLAALAHLGVRRRAG